MSHERPPQRVDRIYAWVAQHEDGNEGVCGVNIPGIGMMALIGADRARIESQRDQAEMIAAASGLTVRLKMFVGGVVIDEIERRPG